MAEVNEKLKLDFFNCTVRLGGNLLHEVNKGNVSNWELKVLRKVHGSDAVVNVKRLDSREIQDELEEAFRLARIYGKKVVEETLRVDLEEYDTWFQMQQEQEQAEREAAQKARHAEFVKGQRDRAREELARAANSDREAEAA